MSDRMCFSLTFPLIACPRASLLFFAFFFFASSDVSSVVQLFLDKRSSHNAPVPPLLSARRVPADVAEHFQRRSYCRKQLGCFCQTQSKFTTTCASERVSRDSITTQSHNHKYTSFPCNLIFRAEIKLFELLIIYTIVDKL